MREITVKCDGEGCQQVKREVNHWWILKIMFHKSEVEGQPPRRYASVIPWAEAMPMEIEKGKHYCGSACLLKAVANWMGK